MTRADWEAATPKCSECARELQPDFRLGAWRCVPCGLLTSWERLMVRRSMIAALAADARAA